MAKRLSIAFIIACIVGAYVLFTRMTSEPTTNTRQPSSQEGGVKIIAFGDSLTAGYGLPVSEAYPAQLEEALQSRGYSVTVINAGVSGETTRGNVERASFIRSQNPDIVLLGIGGNDALRALPIEETRKNLSESVEILTSGENPPTVVLLGMQAPLNAGFAYKREFDALYPSIAQTYDLPLVPFITPEVFLNQQYKLSDGIHLNRAGYGKVVELYLLEGVEDVLKGRE